MSNTCQQAKVRAYLRTHGVVGVDADVVREALQ